MKRKDNIDNKVEAAFQVLQNPRKFEGSPAFETRLRFDFQKPKGISRHIVPGARLAEAAAVALLVLNVAFFTQWKPASSSVTHEEGIDLLLETYTLLPAASNNNYLPSIPEMEGAMLNDEIQVEL